MKKFAILDKPYVSDYLIQTLEKIQVSVLNNKSVNDIEHSNKISLVDETTLIKELIDNQNSLIYCNSENSIEWIIKNLDFTPLPQKIKMFKDKANFRTILNKIYPDFFYKEIGIKELEQINITEIKTPFILKPSIGFFSMGVYKVNSTEEWSKVLFRLKKEIEDIKGRYPQEVVDFNKYIIEEYIEGEEYAVDAYYNDEGKPVILNILKHLFSSDEDVSDRIYVTSKEIIQNHLEIFYVFLTELGRLTDLRNFPVHIELKIDTKSRVNAIELNPMRFAGWCTTDIAEYAYEINVYDYYFSQKEPDWDKILKDKGEEIYSIVVADIPKDIEIKDIAGIDHDSFNAVFSHPLEIRKIDYHKHSVFAFVFARTQPEFGSEILKILNSNFKEFIILKDKKKRPLKGPEL